MLAVGSTLYVDSSNALWKTDGTEAGTVLVKSFDSLQSMISMGSSLYFQASDGITNAELWKSDGTTAGTVMVKDIVGGAGGSYPKNLTVVGNTLYFFAFSESTGYQLWKSDGTAAGTLLVKDTAVGDSHEDFLIAVGNTLYFEATDGASGFELWKSNGTAAGTVRVRDIVAGSGSSFPRSAIRLGGTLYFGATDNTGGYGLWKSDGTAAGTVMVSDKFPTSPTIIGNTLYFVASDGTSGSELWKSDGTAAGTMMVKDISAGSSGSYPNSLTAIGNMLYFRAFDGSNNSVLWKSDGTEEGTVLVQGLAAEIEGSNPLSLKVAGNRLFFTALTEEEGGELWAMGLFSATLSGITATPGHGNSNLLISGQVNPFPGATVTIEYGTTPDLGNTHVVGDFTGSDTLPFSATLYPGGLAPVSTYYYRVRATGEFGVVDSGVLSQVSFSENADLSGISLSTGTLSPPFSGGTINYNSTLPYSTSSISVTPTKADQSASIAVSINEGGHTTVVSGSPIEWPLNVGPNQLEILVTAQSGRTRTYVVNVTRLGLPTLSVFSATAVGFDGATLGGDVQADGGSAITERGVIYSPTAINADLYINGPDVTKVTVGGAVGAFTAAVSDLEDGRRYSFRAFATNSEGTSYSNVLVFYTDTTVMWEDGTDFFANDLVLNVRQRYHLTLDELRIVSFASGGGSRLRAELRNASNQIVAILTGGDDFSLKELLPAGSYTLDLYRTNGSSQPQNYTLTIDATVVPATRPDVTTGPTAAAHLGAEIYLPSSQSVNLTSFRAGPLTGVATVSNRGNFPDIQSVRASGGNAFFAVSYFGPEGNVTAALLTGDYRTPELEIEDTAIPISVSITPNKKKLIKKKGRKTRILKKTLVLKITATSTFDPAIMDEASIRVQTR